VEEHEASGVGREYAAPQVGNRPPRVLTHGKEMAMLEISAAAEAALRRIRLQNDVPEDAAVRIGAIETPNGIVGIGFSFTDGPEAGDQTISDRDGFRVYLAKGLAAPLSEAALEETSNSEGITLQLRTQEQLSRLAAGTPGIIG
jgi:Fe-S cluster assembly iron-binding protein IscA